jgi:hypothetical protein
VEIRQYRAVVEDHDAGADAAFLVLVLLFVGAEPANPHYRMLHQLVRLSGARRQRLRFERAQHRCIDVTLCQLPGRRARRSLEGKEQTRDGRAGEDEQRFLPASEKARQPAGRVRFLNSHARRRCSERCARLGARRSWCTAAGRAAVERGSFHGCRVLPDDTGKKLGESNIPASDPRAATSRWKYRLQQVSLSE